MDKLTIHLSPRAVKDLDNFSDGIVSRIVKAMQVLEKTPFPRGKLIKKIRGKASDYYRLRIDKYRVFYMIEGVIVVVLLRVISKKDAERFIQRLD